MSKGNSSAKRKTVLNRNTKMQEGIKDGKKLQIHGKM
jgi:hypothetical protein